MKQKRLNPNALPFLPRVVSYDLTNYDGQGLAENSAMGTGSKTHFISDLYRESPDYGGGNHAGRHNVITKKASRPIEPKVPLSQSLMAATVPVDCVAFNPASRNMYHTSKDAKLHDHDDSAAFRRSCMPMKYSGFIDSTSYPHNHRNRPHRRDKKTSKCLDPTGIPDRKSRSFPVVSCNSSIESEVKCSPVSSISGCDTEEVISEIKDETAQTPDTPQTHPYATHDGYLKALELLDSGNKLDMCNKKASMWPSEVIKDGRTIFWSSADLLATRGFIECNIPIHLPLSSQEWRMNKHESFPAAASSGSSISKITPQAIRETLSTITTPTSVDAFISKIRICAITFDQLKEYMQPLFYAASDNIDSVELYAELTSKLEQHFSKKSRDKELRYGVKALITTELETTIYKCLSIEPSTGETVELGSKTCSSSPSNSPCDDRIVGIMTFAAALYQRGLLPKEGLTDAIKRLLAIPSDLLVEAVFALFEYLDKHGLTTDLRFTFLGRLKEIANMPNLYPHIRSKAREYCA